MTLDTWSQTASDNDDGDTTINLKEGQASSSLNNSVRAVMAAVAKFRDDISGNLDLGGVSTAYTVTTNQVFAALTDGLSIVAKPNVTNGAAATFSPDALTAKAIESPAGTAVAAGALLADVPYKFTYDATADAWLVGERYGDTMSSASNPDLAAIEAVHATDAETGFLKRTGENTWDLDVFTTALTLTKDNSGTAIQTGIIGDLEVPFDCTITGVKMLADQTGSIVVDIWKDTYANYPPTDADSITASAPPTISSGTKATDTTLTGWTTAISAGDILRFNVDSVADVTRLSLSLSVKRS